MSGFIADGSVGLRSLSRVLPVQAHPPLITVHYPLFTSPISFTFHSYTPSRWACACNPFGTHSYERVFANSFPIRTYTFLRFTLVRQESRSPLESILAHSRKTEGVGGVPLLAVSPPASCPSSPASNLQTPASSRGSAFTYAH